MSRVPELASFLGFSKSGICFKSAKKVVSGLSKNFQMLAATLTTFLALLKQIPDFENTKKTCQLWNPVDFLCAKGALALFHLGIFFR